MINYKVAAYITAYQDLEALQTCIKAIQKQSYPVQSIYIVDNSPQPLFISDSSENIIADHYPENIGISGGLKVGLQWSIAQNYDFLWTFDQDSNPSPDVLEKLLNYYDALTQQGNKIGIIAPLPIDHVTSQQWHGLIFKKYRFVEMSQETSDLYECDAVITSGSLISLAASRQTEYPEEGLFIDAVDWEYCMKFRKASYQIYVVKNAILSHRFGSSEQLKTIFRERKITISNYSPLRYYYMCRNHTFVETRLAQKYLLMSVTHRFRFLVIILIKIIFFESSQKLLKTWACLKGTYDGFIGRLGKTW